MVDDQQHTSPEGDPLSQQVAYLRDLAQIVAKEGLSELEIESNGTKLSLKAAVAPVVVSAPEVPAMGLAPSVAPAPRPAKAKKGSETKDEGLVPIVSPIVGVFYRAPSPADPNFVEIGDRVEKGQTIGLVEAMKVFNEITAETGGVIAQIPVETGQLVETGQPLILLKR